MKGTMQLSNKDRKILDRDFANEEVRREEMEHYRPLIQRGSYRLSQGLIRTESEERAHIDKGLHAKLPNPRKRHTLFAVFRKLFG